MKAIAALTILALGAAIAGCAPTTTTTPPDPSPAQHLAESLAEQATATVTPSSGPETPVRYRTVDYSAAVVNAGTPGGFTAFVTVKRTITVQPSSAATITTADDGTLTFTTPADRANWTAAGHPALTPADGTWSTPPGQFSFTPQGSTLTYQQAITLPTQPAALTTQLLGHLRPYAGAQPPAMLILRQLGYLIATAPLTSPTRAAAWRAIALLPGLHLCGPGTDLAARHGQTLCADAGGEQTRILIDPATGAVLAVEQHLLQPSPLYPTVPGDTLTESATFLTE
jgi:hypothetical protein